MPELFTQDYAGSPDDFPILDIEMLISEGLPDAILSKFRVLCDTGSNGELSLTTDQAENLTLKFGKRKNIVPTRNFLADNSVVYSNEYQVTLTFKGQKMPAIVSVIDPKTRRPATEKELKEIESEEVIGILGRGIMDKYLVAFDGLATPKKFSFSTE
jgi:predicted aspartyl protease